MRILKVISFISLLLGMTMADLKLLIAFNRHGARGPISIKYPFENVWYTNGTGQLTSVGIREHYLFGKQFNDRYMN